MVKNRFHSPTLVKTIYDLAEEAAVEIPFYSCSPILVEILEEGDPALLFRNLPGPNYTTSETDPLKVISLLAYEAFEWQAREIMKVYNHNNFSERQKAWLEKYDCTCGKS